MVWGEGRAGEARFGGRKDLTSAKYDHIDSDNDRLAVKT